MRALKFSVFGLILGAAALAAQPAAVFQKPAGAAASFLQDLSQGDRLLFFRLPAEKVEAAKRSFVIRVNLDGRPFTEESYHLNGEASGPLVVELFGLASELRDRLYEKAGRNDRQLSVTVLAGGKVAAELTWEGLLRHNRQLRKGALRPVAVPSEVKSFFSPWPPPAPAARSSKPEVNTKYYGPEHVCAEQCSDDFNFCYYDYCDQRGSCAYCNDYYNSCILNCPTICEDPKSVQDYTTQTVVGSTYNGGFGCYHSLAGGNYYYYPYTYTIKNTQYRKTTNCDGSTSTQEISYWYTYASCFEKGGTCPFPSGTMYQSCTN